MISRKCWKGLACCGNWHHRLPSVNSSKQEVKPGPQQCKRDEAFVEDIRARSDTVYHPSCTCMMGPDQHNAVVDSQCRVYGVEGLRVVDTSIFPNVTSGNTNAPDHHGRRKGGRPDTRLTGTTRSPHRLFRSIVGVLITRLSVSAAMLLSILLFSLMDANVKWLGSTYPTCANHVLSLHPGTWCRC